MGGIGARIGVVVAVGLGLLGAGLPLGDVTVSAAGCDPDQPAGCTLAEVADLARIRLGATAEAAETTDPQYAPTLATHFNALTPENAMKWYTIQPTDGGWDFGPGDTVVDFAVAQGMEIRGHTLVWSQDQFTPAWVKAITDQAVLQAEVDEHITTVMEHFGDRVHRWDVVNEPLATLGTGLATSVFHRVLDAEWIADAFRLAHSIDPDAELWINEYGSDWVAGKHAAYLALVQQLVADGVPIHGVGIQTHRLPGLPIDRAVFEAQLRDFTALGLDVAITELDVPVSPTDPEAFTGQAEQYGAIVDACLAVDRCVEITTWGVTDAYTWLDSLGLFPTPTRPLLFDGAYQPKPAYVTVRESVAAAATDSRIGVASVAVPEGDADDPRALDVTVTLSEPASQTTGVEYQLVALGATYPDDVTPEPGVWRPLVFRAANGSTPTTKTIRLKVSPDLLPEGSESLGVVLRSPTGGYRLSAPVAFATILDDDPDATARVSVGDGGVVEGDRTRTAAGRNGARVLIALDRRAAAPVSVRLTVAAGTAGSADFVASSRTITFPAGKVARTVTIPVTVDREVEGTETIVLTLSSPTGVALGRSVGTVSIVDDD